MDMPKEYDAEIVFGISTDTADASGRVRARNDSFELPKEAVFSAFQRLSATLNRFRPWFLRSGIKGSAFTSLLAKGSRLSGNPGV